MGDHNSTSKRADKRRCLAVLFSVTPGGAAAVEAIDIYLEVLKKVPVEFVQLAAHHLMETWTSEDHYSAPAPADILQTARRFRRDMKIAELEAVAEGYWKAERERYIGAGKVREIVAKVTKGVTPL